jgi:thioredoxin reductase
LITENNFIPKGYNNKRVLLVGDGDLSFAAALSSLKVSSRVTVRVRVRVRVRLRY